MNGAMKESNIWLMLYEIIRWTSFFFISHLHLDFLTQRLKEIRCRNGEFGIKGAQYLADALQDNTVNYVYFPLSSLFSSWLFHIDINHTPAWVQ
jgi:hypothetical protein